MKKQANSIDPYQTPVSSGQKSNTQKVERQFPYLLLGLFPGGLVGISYSLGSTFAAWYYGELDGSIIYSNSYYLSTVFFAFLMSIVGLIYSGFLAIVSHLVKITYRVGWHLAFSVSLAFATAASLIPIYRHFGILILFWWALAGVFTSMFLFAILASNRNEEYS